MESKEYTPQLGHAALTPLYDVAIRYLTREKAWRSALIEQIDLKPGDRLIDVGCGTGSLLVDLAMTCPTAELIGVDPDEQALVAARAKAREAGVSIRFVPGFLEHANLPIGWQPNKISSSLMFHQVPYLALLPIFIIAFRSIWKHLKNRTKYYPSLPHCHAKVLGSTD